MNTLIIAVTLVRSVAQLYVNMSFKSKVVVVSGASQGIGAAIAIKFAEEGAQVVIVGRNKDKLAEVVAKCGKSALAIAADVTKEDDCKRVIKETITHFGKLDVLVNNAGIFELARITDDRAMEIFDKVMITNLRSTVCLTNLAAPHLISTKGNIVNISSVASLDVKAGKDCFAYGASKAGMDHFGRCVALELASSGVRVNTINPGPVKTDIISNAGIVELNDDSPWEHMKQLTALKRVSEPIEVADLTVFLASDKALGITGSAFTLDNGVMLESGLLKL